MQNESKKPSKEIASKNPVLNINCRFLENQQIFIKLGANTRQDFACDFSRQMNKMGFSMMIAINFNGSYNAAKMGSCKKYSNRFDLRLIRRLSFTCFELLCSMVLYYVHTSATIFEEIFTSAIHSQKALKSGILKYLKSFCFFLIQ